MALAKLRFVNSRLPWSSFQDRFQRATNILLAGTLLLFTLPLWALICLIIKLDSPGPLLARQPRLLADGRRIFVLRFRTAVHDAPRARPIWHPPETRVGQFLRFSRIEDLPQLINVLRGEMTLIGTGRAPRIFED